MVPVVHVADKPLSFVVLNPIVLQFADENCMVNGVKSLIDKSIAIGNCFFIKIRIFYQPIQIKPIQ